MKTGLVNAEFSRFYGAAMDERHAGDYDLTQLDYESASQQVLNAAKFLDQIEQVLHQMRFNDE